LDLSQRKTVAVIEDDPFMRASMVRLLSALGYGTEAFDSAEAFLNTAARSEVVCLVADIQLGGLSGIDLAHQLKVDGFAFPIIFMTALDDERIRSRALASGCVALLRKPFSAQLLSHALVKATG
jgi:FixJ family two-component response regulator